MQDRDDPPPPYFGDYPDGSYWSAVPLGEEPDSEDEDYTVEGTDLRLMWDEGGGPLWSVGGCLPSSPVWLHRALGISELLATDLVAWLEAMNDFQYGSSTDEWRTRHQRLDERADELVERLRAEVGTRYDVRYRGRMRRH